MEIGIVHNGHENSTIRVLKCPNILLIIEKLFKIP